MAKPGNCRTCDRPLGWHEGGACPRYADGSPAYAPKTKGERVKGALRGAFLDAKPKKPRGRDRFTA
ncbi:hypothetical protein AB0L00_01480 [Actinoallomurus sp. NPDC052308]|uniref:hypothetical protein n=1 Tax=Actinoallomurus sp. NPDC052308 TaxID=3155530 RepID=UPI003415F882